jgi:hypothetical protein
MSDRETKNVVMIRFDKHATNIYVNNILCYIANIDEIGDAEIDAITKFIENAQDIFDIKFEN